MARKDHQGPLIVFDCDGVLVDSEILVMEIEVEMLAERGVALSVEGIAERYVGLSYASMYRKVRDEFGVELDAEFDRRLAARIADTLLRALEPVRGMDALVARLQAPRCVASSSGMPRITRSLEKTALIEHLAPHLFSAETVARGKPAPDLFLLAAETVGFAPEDCVVVEDSPYGVEAGVAAGMRVLGFTGGRHCGSGLGERLRGAGATDVARDARELERHLAALGADFRA